ncbi:hypothetical protein HUS23_07055 [Ectothiorhodospiraceae bacterium 2226]|nr:hypothetical protein HUS23_07055 [Ectothiorhodospiraceae bacterium 2226]
MIWIDCLMNREAVATLYASSHGLERMDVLEVTLHREGPTMRLRADLARFPDRPPRRWAPSANTAQVTLDFLAVTDLALRGFGVSTAAALTVEQAEEGRLRFNVGGADTHVSGTCAGLRLVGISAYAVEVDAPRP